MKKLFGTAHRQLLDWLEQEWWPNGPAVCLIEGFPGVGKTRIAEDLLERLGGSVTLAPMLDCPAAGVGLVDDLLLNLAETLSEQGDSRLADGLSEATLKSILSGPVLLILDELQRSFQPGTGRPEPVLSRLLEELARGRRRGRILLLSSRDVERARGNERWEIRTLNGLPPTEGAELLEGLLQHERLDEPVPPERRVDIATWLGGYPRALTLFAKRLRYEPLDELLGLAAETWEGRDRKVSRTLLERFESEMFERARAGLEPAAERFLRRLAVFRRPVELKAMEHILDPGEPLAPLRDELVARFMIELRRQRYAMPSLLRDTVLAGLADEPRRQAHRMAGDWFARHFRARQIVGHAEKLGGAFVEARYHFVQAEDTDALGEIGRRFEAHVRATMGWSSPVPGNPEALDERIGLLSALLSDRGGARGLHFYLAKLLAKRRRGGDLKRALHHAEQGTGPQSPSEAWIQRIKLEAEVNGVGRITDIVHQQVATADPDADVYVAGARALQAAGRTKEGLKLLREGIGKVGPHQNLFALYQAAARILDQRGRTEERTRVLREGLRSLPRGGSTSRYRVANALLYGAYAERDELLLANAISATGDEALDPSQQALGQVLLTELSGNWAGAAALSAQARQTWPRLLDLAVRESFAYLCGGDWDKERGALERFPGLRIEQGNPSIWLLAFIALQAGDLSVAQDRLGTFFGEFVSGDEDSLRRLLLKTWDESAESNSAQRVSYYFPHLPPILTGLDQTITRRQFGPSALAGAADREKAASPEVPPMSAQDARPLNFLSVCTEWFSRHGGVPTFNRDLCIELQRAGHRVVCLVADKDADEEAHATANGITALVSARQVAGLDEKARLCLGAPMPEGFVPDVVIGHDHVTGAAAKEQAEHHFPGSRRIHVIHTAPGEIEWFKTQQGTTAAAKAEHKELSQLELAASAQLVVAVGPRLHAEIATTLDGHRSRPPLHRLDPGIGSPEGRRDPPHLSQVLLLGRTEDAELKGLDIAARAIGLMG